MKTKWLIGLVALLIVVGVVLTIWIQGRRISKLKREISISQVHSVQHYLESEYIPEILQQKTTDELAEMGGKLWGE